ncbi:MAG: efflux transporter outer membrane subunit [Sinimarinibacterium sp.]|jgi:NodT family efflux transporter outer membrane factor (OMF) lipoprotein
MTDLNPMRLGLTLAAAMALPGCVTVGADDRAPEPAVPAQWSAAADPRAPDAAVLAHWWQQFGDPVLDGLVDDALATSLDLATAQAQLREARAQRRVAGAALGPAVDASATAARSTSSEESGSGATRELYSASFDASWELDLFGGLRRGTEAAAADVEASVESLRGTRVSLIAEVVLNYADLRTAERRRAVTQASVAALADNYDLTYWRQQAGLVSELDAAQARTQLASARAGLPALDTAVDQAQNRLAVLVGRTPGELRERLATTAAIPLAASAIAAGIPADTLRQRPDVRAAERRLAAQTARLGQAQAARYPSLNLSGSIGLEALAIDRLGGSGAATRSLLAGLTAPIFDSGRIRAAIEVEDAQLEQARLAYRAAVLAALEDVENALVALANTGARRERLEQAAASARETLQIAEQRYASGLIDFLAVLDAQRTLLDLEDQLAAGSGDLAGAQIRLYKALGGGWSTATAPEDSRASR